MRTPSSAAALVALCLLELSCARLLGVGVTCRVDGECPIHQYCDDEGACLSGCLSNAGCDEGTVCSLHGHCAPPGVNPDTTVDLASVDDLGAGDATPMTGPAVCGDGVISGDEECDAGDSNSDVATAQATCTTSCKRRAPCGLLTNSQGAAIDPATGHCFVAWAGPLSWQAAERDCLRRAGTLVNINDANEQALLAQLAGTALRWIGLSRPASSGPFAWVSTEALGFSQWAAGQPSGAGECALFDPASGWIDSRCGWVSQGMLPASADRKQAYVCEHACGNGRLEAGEECDPPGLNCTSTCKTIRSCTEAGGRISQYSGHCYFAYNTKRTFAAASAICPAGTHLATLNDQEETEASKFAISGDTWIAAQSSATGAFQWNINSEDLNTRKYHGFIQNSPKMSGPACVLMTHFGWDDRDCAELNAQLCERE